MVIPEVQIRQYRKNTVDAVADAVPLSTPARKRFRKVCRKKRMSLDEFRQRNKRVCLLWKKDPEQARIAEKLLCIMVCKEVWRGNPKAIYMAREMRDTMINSAGPDWLDV